MTTKVTVETPKDVGAEVVTFYQGEQYLSTELPPESARDFYVYGDVAIAVVEQEMTKPKVYIAGPMSGYPEFNFPAFFRAEEILTAAGYEVFNPANKESERELDPGAYEVGDAALAKDKGFDFRECYTWDVMKVIEADAIFMLPGWEDSPGARGEHAVAVAMRKHFPEYDIIYGFDDLEG